MIFKLSTGDEVHRYQKTIVVQFQDERKVLSTSLLNGGYCEALNAVYNHDENPGAGMECKMEVPDHKENARLLINRLGLDPERTAGISTAASMDNVSIKSKTYKDITVTAIVTGGVEVNGGRVGDPTIFHEEDGKFTELKHGTINIILVIDADLPSETMTRALVTCTEAKTAALQELMAGSNYSRGLATGSGTDGTIIISNSKSKKRLLFAGKHSKLGELIGLTVKAAVKEALFLQSGLCPESQHSLLKRGKRFGINEDRLWEAYQEINNKSIKEEKIKFLNKPQFLHNLHTIERNEDLVILTSLYVHIMDQLDWELLSKMHSLKEGEVILNRIKESFGNKKDGWSLDIEQNKVDSMSFDKIIEYMVDNYILIIAEIVGDYSCF